MSFPEKKRKKTTTTKKSLLNPSQSTPITSLPDDLLLSCISSVSTLYHPTLSLVSKTFRSLLSSPELYKTRSLLNRRENCVYVCLSFPPYPNYNLRWFTLCRRPNRTLNKKKKLSDIVLVPIASPLCTPLQSNFVAVGSDIYKIGRLINDVPSSSVSVLNCWSNSWRQVPNMEIPRVHPFAITIDGKILVKGGLRGRDFNSAKWVEIFDPKTKTWTVTCEPNEWESADGISRQSSSRCMIDSVFYYYLNGEFLWSETDNQWWRALKGLVGLPKILFNANTTSHVQLADFGGKLGVLWDRHDRSSNNGQGRVISCAEIALERCNSEEMSGTVVWFDTVLKVPKFFAFEHVIAATV